MNSDSARERFTISDQHELSYIVLYKGEVVNEFGDKADAQEWVDFWAGEIEQGRLSGLEQAAQIAEESAHKFPANSVTRSALRTLVAAIREKITEVTGEKR